jgi:hypothetical protein
MKRTDNNAPPKFVIATLARSSVVAGTAVSQVETCKLRADEVIE